MILGRASHLTRCCSFWIALIPHREPIVIVVNPHHNVVSSRTPPLRTRLFLLLVAGLLPPSDGPAHFNFDAQLARRARVDSVARSLRSGVRRPDDRASA